MENLNDLKKFWKKKKIFITGHTGFKGTWLSIILNLLGSKVFGYSLPPEKNNLFIKSKIKNELSSNIYGNIKDIKKLKTNIKRIKPEIIFHLAAQPLVIDSYKHPLETIKTNVIGTANLLECIRSIRSVKSVLIITTDKVYKIDKKNKIYSELDQLGGYDPYSASKVAVETITDSYIKSFFKTSILKNKISTVRAGNVIGGGDFSKDRLVPDIMRAINNKKKLSLRNPKNIRPWQHVLDPLIGYLIIAKKQFNNNITKNFHSWNLGPSKNNFKRVINIVKYIQKKEKFSFRIIQNQKFKETKILRLNSSNAKKKLKWSNKWSLYKALDETIKWNSQIKKGVPAKYICEQQFLMYINNN